MPGQVPVILRISSSLGSPSADWPAPAFTVLVRPAKATVLRASAQARKKKENSR